MKKYVLTSQLFAGAVTFWYNDLDLLVYYHNEGEMSEKQHVWLLKHMPRELVELDALRQTVKGSIEELPPDLSFDTFWDVYDKKINRKRCEPMWKKLSDADKMKALAVIKKYDAYCQRTGVGKAHPDNFMSKEYYLVDWSKVK